MAALGFWTVEVELTLGLGADDRFECVVDVEGLWYRWAGCKLTSRSRPSVSLASDCWSMAGYDGGFIACVGIVCVSVSIASRSSLDQPVWRRE